MLGYLTNATMQKLEENIATAGFKLSDVVFVRAYLAPAADGKVERAVVGIDHQISEREWFAADELFLLTAEGRAVGLEVHRVKRAVGPVAGEQRRLVPRGETGTGAEHDAGVERALGLLVDPVDHRVAADLLLAVEHDRQVHRQRYTSDLV